MSSYTTPAFKRLWIHIRRDRRNQLFSLLIIMIITSFAEVVSIGAVLPFLSVLVKPEYVFEQPLIQQFLAAFGLGQSNQLLLILTCVFILATLISGAMRLALLWTQTRLGYAIGADFSIEIYKKTLFRPYCIHVRSNTSEVIAGITSKTGSVIGSTVLPLLYIASSTLILITILVALTALNPAVALSTFGGFAAIYIAIMFFAKNRLARDSQRISRESSQVIKALQEGLGGIRDVLIDGTQQTYYQIYRNADNALRKSQANIQIIGGAPRFLIESFGMILIALLAYAITVRGTEVVSAIPLLGALALGAQRLLPVLQQLYSSWTGVRGGRASLEDVLDLLDQPLPDYANQTALTPIPFKESISLHQVGFRYSPSSPWVLHGVDFQIPKGSRVGLIGVTGSGKSTLVDLMMGLLEPTIGKMAIDDVAITPQNCRNWQAHIAHVPQAIFLADTTIAGNIAFGIHPDEIDINRVKDAARQAQLEVTIESWANKYQTVVGERGVRLSGGQRQRIGIARALYKRADVIIFDEATSALDNSTEAAVMEAIQNIGQNITIIIVAHRLTTLKDCNMIIDLANGEVRRIGSYKEIIQSESSGRVTN